MLEKEKSAGLLDNNSSTVIRAGFTDNRTFNVVSEGKKLFPVPTVEVGVPLVGMVREKLTNLDVEVSFKKRLIRSALILDHLTGSEEIKKSILAHSFWEEDPDLLGVVESIFSWNSAETLQYLDNIENKDHLRIFQEFRYLFKKPRFEVFIRRRKSKKNSAIAKELKRSASEINDIAGDLIYLRLVDPSNPAAREKSESFRIFATGVKMLRQQGFTRKEIASRFRTTTSRVSVAINRLIRVGDIFPVPHHVAFQRRNLDINVEIAKNLTLKGINPELVSEATGLSYSSVIGLRGRLRGKGLLPSREIEARKKEFLKFLIGYQKNYPEKIVSIDGVSRVQKFADRVTLLRWYHQLEVEHKLPPIKKIRR